jgi:hypothetical protein
MHDVVVRKGCCFASNSRWKKREARRKCKKLRRLNHLINGKRHFVVLVTLSTATMEKFQIYFSSTASMIYSRQQPLSV